MTNDKYILENGKIKVVDLMTWAEWFEKADRHIGNDFIDGVRVSTVFLGIDHNFGEGEPLLFETMIFGGEHSDYQERYSTLEEAKQGHLKAIKLAKTIKE